jgi:hypothetical protein
LVMTILQQFPIMLLKRSKGSRMDLSNGQNVGATYEESEYDPFITKRNAKFLKKEETILGPKIQEKLESQVKSQPGQGRKAVSKEGVVDKTEIYNTMTWPDSCK